ncbi:hypothetical protein BDE02_03G033100 [Populus trichocarpa]|nr:hypothetical protein BDE02_03G033100 [Populus trichocarpa]
MQTFSHSDIGGGCWGASVSPISLLFLCSIICFHQKTIWDVLVAWGILFLCLSSWHLFCQVFNLIGSIFSHFTGTSFFSSFVLHCFPCVFFLFNFQCLLESLSISFTAILVTSASSRVFI